MSAFSELKKKSHVSLIKKIKIIYIFQFQLIQTKFKKKTFKSNFIIIIIIIAFIIF